jgi:hypothetical protein
MNGGLDALTADLCVSAPVLYGRILKMARATATLGKPACDLAGVGENITKIVLRVTSALDKSGQKDAGSAFWESAMRLRTAAQVVELARAYVEVM